MSLRLDLEESQWDALGGYATITDHGPDQKKDQLGHRSALSCEVTLWSGGWKGELTRGGSSTGRLVASGASLE